MDKIKLVIEVSREDQLEIENICVERGKSFSQYFLELHRINNPSYEHNKNVYKRQPISHDESSNVIHEIKPIEEIQTVKKKNNKKY